MSRYALEWAKQQQLGDPATKLVLLLIADRANSHKHRCALFDAALAGEAHLTLDELASAIARLTTLGLLQSEPWKFYYSDSPATRYELQIPKGITFGRLAEPKSSPDEQERRTALYRLFAAENTLLYIGIANDVERRFKQHERTKRWWPQVTLREIEWFGTRAEAESAEVLAIVTENPRHNEQNTFYNAWTSGGGVQGRRPE